MKCFVTLVSCCIISYEIFYLLCSTKCMNTMLTNMYKIIIWCPSSVSHSCPWQHKTLDNSSCTSNVIKCFKNSTTYKIRFQLLFMEVAAKAPFLIKLLHAFCHSLSFSLPLLFLSDSSLLIAFFFFFNMVLPITLTAVAFFYLFKQRANTGATSKKKNPSSIS